MPDEYSEGGSKIYRHAKEEFKETYDDLGESSLAAIEAHITSFVGEPSFVLHEIVSPTVHVDVHVVEPGPDRDFYTLVTVGNER